MTIYEWVVCCALAQAAIAWMAAVALWTRHGRAALDGVLVCLLTPLWGLGLLAALFFAWRHRVGLRSEMRHAKRSVVAATTRGVRRVRSFPSAVVSWARFVRQAFGGDLSELSEPPHETSAASTSSQLIR
jgi:hypothetical protein